MLSSILSAEDIKFNLESEERDECFAELLEYLVIKHPEINRKEALCAIIEREEKNSTAVYPKVSVPHAVCKSLKKTAMVIGISRKGIEFENPDSANLTGVKVNVIFEILFEEDDTESHLHLLRDVLQLVSNPKFIDEILLAKNSQEVLNLITSFEN